MVQNVIKIGFVVSYCVFWGVGLLLWGEGAYCILGGGLRVGRRLLEGICIVYLGYGGLIVFWWWVFLYFFVCFGE